jgi:hypothetical protein
MSTCACWSCYCLVYSRPYRSVDESYAPLDFHEEAGSSSDYMLRAPTLCVLFSHLCVMSNTHVGLYRSAVRTPARKSNHYSPYPTPISAPRNQPQRVMSSPKSPPSLHISRSFDAGNDHSSNDADDSMDFFEDSAVSDHTLDVLPSIQQGDDVDVELAEYRRDRYSAADRDVERRRRELEEVRELLCRFYQNLTSATVRSP